jgi:hypothetical protein
MRRHDLGLALCALLAITLAGACGDDTLPSDEASASSSSSSSGTGGGGPDCVTDPMTHVEIINACTDAEKIDKIVNLPLLGSDGSLPPLP